MTGAKMDMFLVAGYWLRVDGESVFFVVPGSFSRVGCVILMRG